MVIDDGLDSSHPDLAPNFSAEISHDFNGEDEDVSPRWRLGAQLLCDIAIDTNDIIVTMMKRDTIMPRVTNMPRVLPGSW